jgi:hypothetical protein
MFVNSFSGWSIAVYDWIGSAWNRRTNPTALGTYGYYCALSADGTKLAIGSGDGIKAVYIWSGSAWASYSLPTLPTSAVYGIRILSNKIVFSDGGSANPRVLDISALQTKITFNSAPANGAVITADYTVNGIHKTNQRVIDLYAEIVFGEPV